MSDELNMSSVTADPAPETAGKRAAPEEKPPKTPGKRAGLIIGIAAAVLVLAYAGCCVAANALYSHTAFPNTSVLGMDMSGLSAQEAEQRWTEQGSALLDGMTIRLTRDGQEIGSTTLSDLGVAVLPVYVSKAAGCDVQDRGWGSDVTAFLRGGWRFIESWFRAVDVTPQLDVDEAKLTAACEQLSDTVGCTVTDGGYRLAEGGPVHHQAAGRREAGRGGAARRVGAALREPRPVRGSPVRGMCVRGPHRRAHGRAGAPRRDRRHHGRRHLRQIHRQAHPVPRGRTVRCGDGAKATGRRPAGRGIPG